MDRLLFEDYESTKHLYHVVSLKKLGEVLKEGIHYNHDAGGRNKHLLLHRYLDNNKPDWVPDWVVREHAIFSSFNFPDDHQWHSHSALLSIRVKPDKCWVCNENIANTLYEPLVLQLVPGFESAALFLEQQGERIVKDYWQTSLSFEDNLKVRRDQKAGYDAEVLIFHDIPPEDIQCLFIASDHQIQTSEAWRAYFRSDRIDYSCC